jgi:hypothetical protein
MRPFSSLVATFAIAASLAPTGCEIATGEVTNNLEPLPGAGGADAASPTVSTRDGGTPGTGGSPGATPALAPAAQLVTGAVSISSVTSDGWVVYRDADVLRAVKIATNPVTEDILDNPGSVLVRGRVVFNWSNVDWTTNMGDLSVWAAGDGTHHIGSTAYAEGLVAASKQGRAIAYTANMKAETTDLMIAPSDLSAPKVLIEAMGRGSDTTCGANIGFVGERLFVGWCSAGSAKAKIERFENIDGAWTRTRIAEDSLSSWSADETGERVFYQSSDYGGYYAESGEKHFIDASVSTGFVLPDGSAALYTVGDQLRRTTLPDVNPLAIVTRGYSQPAAFSSGYDMALYSTKVTYDRGTRRDLRITRTDVFTLAPIELVPDPIAELPRTSLTKDGRFVLYLTDMTPSGATLHVRTTDGDERIVLPNVAEAVAAHDSVIVFSDGSSDPNQYPITADLKVVDLATSAPPTLLESKILEGRNFQLDATGTRVLYVRSGIDRDASPEREGLFVRTIP